MAAVTGGTPDVSPEVEALRRCISDVVALSTLSAVWAGASRHAVAVGLAQVLHDTLGADLVCVGLRAGASAGTCEAVWPPGPRPDTLSESICASITRWSNQVDPDPDTIDLPPTALACVVTPIGITAEHGVIVTVLSGQPCPTDIHRLLLNLAGNQAVIALLAARARDAERVADTLQRVGSGSCAPGDARLACRGTEGCGRIVGRRTSGSSPSATSG